MLKLNNIQMPIKTTIKYLGLHFTNLYKFTNHIKKIAFKTNIALIKLKSLLSPHKGVRTDVKVIIYKQIVRPLLTYAFPIWFNV